MPYESTFSHQADFEFEPGPPRPIGAFIEKPSIPSTPPCARRADCAHGTLRPESKACQKGCVRRYSDARNNCQPSPRDSMAIGARTASILDEEIKNNLLRGSPPYTRKTQKRSSVLAGRLPAIISSFRFFHTQSANMATTASGFRFTIETPPH